MFNIDEIRVRCKAAIRQRTDLPDCLNEIERLRTLLRTISTKHNLLKQLAVYGPCKCRGSELCMKHAAADILGMIKYELEIDP